MFKFILKANGYPYLGAQDYKILTHWLYSSDLWIPRKTIEEVEKLLEEHQDVEVTLDCPNGTYVIYKFEVMLDTEPRKWSQSGLVSP